MKILFLTLSHPKKRSGPNIFIKNLVSRMRTKIDVEIIWIVCEPQKIKEEKNELEVIYDIRNFHNAVDILNKFKPDCVFADNNKFNSTQHAISIASKFKKIPLIHFKPIEKKEESINTNEDIKKIPKKTIQNIQRFFSDVNKENEESKNIKRGKFIFFKHNFLFKTRAKVKMSFLKNLFSYLDDLSSYFWRKERIHAIADLQLVNNQDWMNYFKKIGFKEDKLALTGSPNWDQVHEKISNRSLEKIEFDGRKIQILIITSPLVEHGYGTYDDRNEFLRKIIEKCNPNKFKIEFKIHPSSEVKSSYQKFFESNNFDFPIHQEEKLWDIIDKYDLVLTYGYGYPQIECAFGAIRTILMKTKWTFPILPIVKAATKSGYFQICENFEDIVPTIQNLVTKKIEINEEIISERENLSYKFDGKAGERAALAVIELLEKKKNYRNTK